MSSASKLGTFKYQKIELTDQSQFKYNASDVLSLNAVSHFEVDQLLPLVRKVRKNYSIPSDPKELNWHHYMTIEEFVCTNTNFTFNENQEMELVEDEEFTISSIF